MKNFASLFFIGLIVFAVQQKASAQATFATIQTIMQTNCGGSGCHGGSNPLVFDVNASATDLRNALVNVNPTNPAALQSGQKLIDPGHPYNSFLLKKIGSNNFDPYITKTTAEGNHMPSGGAPSLAKHEIELVRQWIFAGAPETGTVVNYQVLQDYYANGGLPFINVPAPPPASEGFQVRNGPYFLTPNQEVEIMRKEHLKNSSEISIKKIDGFMSSESHHLLLFKYTDDGTGAREGTRSVPTEAAPFNGNIVLTSAWQDDGEFELPYGTALKWEPNTILDFDYHIKNYSQTQILPTDFYLNIYYYDNPTPYIEMKAQLVNEALLALQPGQNDITRTHAPGGERYIWMMSSHTHKYGIDYDIFVKNSDGTRGDQIYEGFYNSDYSFNQGFYDWEHPAVRYFDPLQPVGNEGMEFNVKWDITGPCTSPLAPLVCITFGLTTADEMMLYTYMYTEQELPTSVNNKIANANKFAVYPNPFESTTAISYSLEKDAEVTIEVFDLMGKKVSTLVDGKMNSGEHKEMFESSYGKGLYYVTLSVNGSKVSTQKIMQL